MEIESRTSNRLKQRIKDAKFPLLKPLETFNLDAVPKLDIRIFREPSAANMSKAQECHFSWQQWPGKTHMATALGLEACKNNYNTRFITCYGLVNELVEAREQRELQRIIKRYSRYDLLILDELGYIPFSKEGAELLFQVLLTVRERACDDNH
jgi:DNA replication protein DnaC